MINLKLSLNTFQGSQKSYLLIYEIDLRFLHDFLLMLHTEIKPSKIQMIDITYPGSILGYQFTVTGLGY